MKRPKPEYRCIGITPKPRSAINREVFAQRRHLTGHIGLNVGVTEVIENVADPARQLRALRHFKATCGHCRGTDTQARGHERRLRVVRHSVFVDGDVRSTQGCVGVFAGQALTNQANQKQVVVGAARDYVVAALDKHFGHGLSVVDHLLLIGFETWLQPRPRSRASMARPDRPGTRRN